MAVGTPADKEVGKGVCRLEVGTQADKVVDRAVGMVACTLEVGTQAGKEVGMEVGMVACILEVDIQVCKVVDISVHMVGGILGYTPEDMEGDKVVGMVEDTVQGIPGRIAFHKSLYHSKIYWRILSTAWSKTPKKATRSIVPVVFSSINSFFYCLVNFLISRLSIFRAKILFFLKPHLHHKTLQGLSHKGRRSLFSHQGGILPHLVLDSMVYMGIYVLGSLRTHNKGLHCIISLGL